MIIEGRTADLVPLGGSGAARLAERDLVEPTGWVGMGFSREGVAGPVLLTAALYGMVHDTRLVPPDAVPRR